MNVFIYDAITEKYKKKTRRFEEQINKLNLQGKIIYLASIKNHKEAIEKEIGSGAKTIIILGNDKTLNGLTNILANISQNIPVFIVPIGDQNKIAESLGIKNEKEAAFILSARRIEKLKIARANNIFFISNCEVKTNNTILKIDGSYSLSFKKDSICKIFNLLDKKCSTQNIKASPQDEILNLYTETSIKDKTIVPIKKEMEILNTEEKILIDNSIEISCPANISLSEKTIDFIVGKDRTF